jgi:hypothetical protein
MHGEDAHTMDIMLEMFTAWEDRPEAVAAAKAAAAQLAKPRDPSARGPS